MLFVTLTQGGGKVSPFLEEIVSLLLTQAQVKTGLLITDFNPKGFLKYIFESVNAADTSLISTKNQINYNIIDFFFKENRFRFFIHLLQIADCLLISCIPMNVRIYTGNSKCR